MLIMKTSYNFLFAWNCMELYGEKIGQPGIIMTIDKKKWHVIVRTRKTAS